MAHTHKSAARAIKRDFAQCLAKGNHLAAANDEPEPLFSEAELIAGDRAEPTAEQKASRDYERALDAQMQRQGATS